MAINFNNLSNSNQVKQNLDLKNQVKQETLVSRTQSHEQAKAARQDSVSITPQAQKLKELQNKSAESPAEDPKKIAELKKAIMSGEYKVDPEKLAASIAKFEFDIDGIR